MTMCMLYSVISQWKWRRGVLLLGNKKSTSLWRFILIVGCVCQPVGTLTFVLFFFLSLFLCPLFTQWLCGRAVCGRLRVTSWKTFNFLFFSSFFLCPLFTLWLCELWTETRQWSIVFTDGKGPCARRRQCCCVVGSKVYLFGGTSPNPNPPSRMPLTHRMERASDLIDHADLHVLDFSQYPPWQCFVCWVAWWVCGWVADGWLVWLVGGLVFGCVLEALTVESGVWGFCCGWLVDGLASGLVFGCLVGWWDGFCIGIWLSGWWDGIWLSEVLVVEFGRVSRGPMRQELYCCKQF